MNFTLTTTQSSNVTTYINNTHSMYETMFYFYNDLTYTLVFWLCKLLTVIEDLHLYENGYVVYNHFIYTVNLFVYNFLSLVDKIDVYEWLHSAEHFTLYLRKFITYDSLYIVHMLYVSLSITYILYNLRNINTYTKDTKDTQASNVNNVRHFEVDVNAFISVDNKRLEYIQKLQSKIKCLENKVYKLKTFINDLETGNIRRSERIRSKRNNKVLQ